MATPTLCLIVFTGLMGCAIILPLLPLLPLLPCAADAFGGSGFAIGAVSASRSVAPPLSAPLLGGASGRLGRKPVQLLAPSGAVLSAVLVAHTTALTTPMTARPRVARPVPVPVSVREGSRS